MDEIITISNLSKIYTWEKKNKGFMGIFKDFFRPQMQTITALNHVSMGIKEGEILGLLGPNGAGKSTLFKCMTGILKPDEGEVTVLGRSAWSERKRIIPYIGAFFGSKGMLWWNLPVTKSYELMKAVYKIPEEDYQRRLDFLLNIIGDQSYVDKPPRQLSYGQRQRAEIITCLLHNPKIVFLDEPTLGMDIMAKEQLAQMIIQYNREYHTTFIVSTHDLNDIEKMCSRIAIINNGVLVCDQDAESIKEAILTKNVITIDFIEAYPKEIFNNLNIIYHPITDRRIEMKIDATEVNIFECLERINKVVPISTFEISHQKIEDVIKKYYMSEPDKS